jgi:hypothetical protein
LRSGRWFVFFVLCGWVSRSSAVVLERKSLFFWYQLCRIVVEGEVEEEANGGKGRPSRWTDVHIFASTVFLGSFVV